MQGRFSFTIEIDLNRILFRNMAEYVHLYQFMSTRSTLQWNDFLARGNLFASVIAVLNLR